MRPLSLLAALSVLLLNSCYSPGDGKAPPLEELYFPTGLALDGLAKSDDGKGGPKYLYVVNSDFDLQYRAASVISYDLDRLREVVPRNCNATADCGPGGGICDAPGVAGIPDDPTRVPSYFCVDPGTTAPCPFGERDEADLVLTPGRCKSIDPLSPLKKLLVDSVGIGAFATDVIWRAKPKADSNPKADSKHQSRLFIPVRGDSTLHWIDLDSSDGYPNGDGHFSCGQNGSDDDRCNEQHRSGDSTSDNPDQLLQPPEPYAVDATADGGFVAVTNQTSGNVSLYANDWSDRGPKLASILNGLPQTPVAIAAVPPAAVASGELPEEAGFLVAYRSASQVDLLRVHTDPFTGPSGVSYTRDGLRPAGSAPINANSLGFDSRGIAIDDAQRQKDYAACRAAQCGPPNTSTECVTQLTQCLRAAHQPAVYVASRAPASLLVGAMTADLSATGTNDLPSFTDTVPLTFGPSRVILGEVRVPGTADSVLSDDAGPYELERRVFVVCFDSRRIFVYDPQRRVIDSIVSTGRGPYALAIDGARGLAYLGHFTDSYLGVISLDQRFPKTYATIVASIGAPKSPRSSK